MRQLDVSLRTGGVGRAELHDRLFAGEIIGFTGLPGAREISRYAQDHFAQALGDVEIASAHTVLDAATLKSRLLQARAAFAADTQVAAAYTGMLVSAGCRAKTTFRDRYVLRANAPVADFETDSRMVLPAHRDSWGSGITTQINWWMPLNTLDAGRTMIVYPDAFDRAIGNDSAGWEWRKSGKQGVPRLPTVTCPHDAELGEPRALIVPPGTLIAFAGAHLHATAVNRTGVPRLSTDTRTIDSQIWASGLGAPDLDHGPVDYAVEWFKGMADGAPLSVPAGVAARI